MSELGKRCEVLPRPYGHPSPLQEVWRSLYNYSRERGGVSDYGRYWPVGKVHERPRPKTWYTKLDPNHMARVRPLGSDGKEIPVSLVYGQVELAAKYSQ